MSFAFVPPDGYRNVTDFPTKPASETAFRDSMQDLLDQMRDYINNSLAVKASGSATWIAPTLLNSWVNLDGTRTVGYYKDDLGIVRLKGVIKSGTIADATPIFTLPAGYRPGVTSTLTTQSNNGTTRIVSGLDITAAGSAEVYSAGNTFFILDGLSFRAEG